MCISSTSIKIIDYLFLHLYLRVIPIMQVIHLSYMYNNCLLNDFIIYYIHAYIYWNLWWYLILKFSKHDIILVNFCILLHVISPGYYDIINMYRDRYFRIRYMTSTTVLCWSAVIILTCTLYLHLQKCTLCLHVDWRKVGSPPNPFEVRLSSYNY